MVAQGCGGIGECATLAGTFREQVVHVACRTRRHEVHGLYAVHEGTAVVVAVPVTEIEREPVPVDVLEVLLHPVGSFAGGSAVEVLAAVREIELGIVAVVTARATDESPHGIIALEMHDHRMGLAILGLQIIAAHDDGLSFQTVGN